MKAFLDTTVFVATFYADHQHHHPSLELFLRYEKRDVACGAHSLAEIYSNLTGMPGKYRVTGVPKTIVNETIEIMGGLPEQDFVRAALDLPETP